MTEEEQEEQEEESCFLGVRIHKRSKQICLGVRSIEHPDVLSEKINFSAPGGPKSTKFDPGHLDPIYFEVDSFSASSDPPICLKMPKCAKFCTFEESRFKYTPKVGVHRENLLMGNVAQTFLGALYICWDYVISFSQHFPMRKFSPSPSPESHLLLQNWLKFRKYFKKNIY